MWCGVRSGRSGRTTRRPSLSDWESSSPQVRAVRLSICDPDLPLLLLAGYVPAAHFDDKPLSGLEFFSYLDGLQLPGQVDRSLYYNSSVLQQTMWTRLALSMVP